MVAQRLLGIVTKAGVMAKTVTLTVEKKLVHPKLLKSFVRHKKYLIHDENNVLSVGDKILAQACRPMSARKRFAFLKFVGDQKEGAERRAQAEKLMSAEDQEKIRVEKLVKAEVARQGGQNGAQSRETQAKGASVQQKAALQAGKRSGTVAARP